jgi:tungstate transport system ATP-binding protein
MIGRLEALDIKKQFNSRFRLSCSLAIEKGPLYTIVGPNGSGKSTLLRMLALIEPPDSGKIIYYDDGTSLLNPCPSIAVRRKAVLVPTRAALFNESVFDNAAYGLRLRGFSRDAIRDPVMESLKEVRLAGRENSHAFELSSGEAQRLALARALAIDPEVLLLDEPTASLDVENTEIIEDLVCRSMNKNKIIVMVTHNLYQAKALSDMVIFMFNGEIVEVTDKQLFFKEPSSELAHKFISGKVY